DGPLDVSGMVVVVTVVVVTVCVLGTDTTLVAQKPNRSPMSCLGGSCGQAGTQQQPGPPSAQTAGGKLMSPGPSRRLPLIVPAPAVSGGSPVAGGAPELPPVCAAARPLIIARTITMHANHFPLRDMAASLRQVLLLNLRMGCAGNARVSARSGRA